MPASVCGVLNSVGHRREAEENRAKLAGGVGQFGTWTVNEADKTLSVHMIADVHFPNEEGTDQKRLISLTGNELKIINLSSGAGGTTKLVFKRVP